MFKPNLKIGDVINNSELMENFGGGILHVLDLKEDIDKLQKDGK